MKTRTLLIGLAGAAACAALAIVMLAHDDNASTSASPTAARVESAPRAVARAGAPAPAVAVEAPAAAPVPVADENGEFDGSQYPVDPAPPTREEPLTDDQRDPRMKRSIEMLDQAVARSEARLAAAEAAGDKAAATTARVRIERLREVRKQRASELESMQ